jgi:hypothetical protein
MNAARSVARRRLKLGYRGDRWLACPNDHITDLEPDEPDPDRKHDEAVERRLFGDDPPVGESG